MNNLVFYIVLLMGMTQNAMAQFWLEGGLKGMVGTTVPFNSNNLNDDKSSFKLASDYAYGAKLAFNFGDNNGFVVDGLLSQSRVNYRYDVAGVVEGEHQLKWRNIDIYPLYRHYYERSFIEIGPKISLLNSMKATNLLFPNGADVKDNFNATNFGASLGFGGYLFGSEFFSVSLNFRIDYQITDFVSAKGEEGGYPLPFRTYDSYKTTNPITARAGLELSIPLGGVAKAQCGQRVFFIGGNR
jgi:hypothetical protein